MNLLSGFGVFLIFVTVSLADDRLVRETEPLSPAAELSALSVPEGFEIQLFAAEPQINKPINLAFDPQGRLWVSSTVEYPYAAAKDRWADPQGSRVKDSRDAIKILEDTDGDGQADRVTDFADGLNIPTGVLPWHKPEHRSGCIAWSIPNIWYFADTTGDGKCDLREVLFGPLGYEKDTHGMCSSFRLGPDGWVYATHGFNNQSHAVARDGSEVKMQSGNVFRFRPDGSRIEIFTSGQVNPFGLCFDQRGNLYSADCHSSPVYQLLRGATYPHFGKPSPGLGFGPVMIQHTHGSTGICGIVYLHSGVWGNEWNDQVLIGNPVNSRVNRDLVKYAGSTPVAVEQSDFVESRDPWFRPVDLTVGPDGALYIADFYNRIIGHYEVPLDHPGRDRERGRIWRVAKKGVTTRPVAPRVESITDPIAALNDPDPHHQRAAASALQFSPDSTALKPLLSLLSQVPVADTHLRHVLKMAIHAHLSLPHAFDDLSHNDPVLLDIALSVATLDAADFLLKAGVQGGSDRVRHIGRYGSEETRKTLISLARDSKNSKSDFAEQAATLQTIAEGLEEGGVTKYRPDLLEWAQVLAPEILKAHQKRNTHDDWVDVPDPGSPSPWVLQPRKCGDGLEASTLSSLATGQAGAEQRTGLIRSRVFPAPEKLGFWICGHRGKPGSTAHEKNLVRLVTAASGDVISLAFPPRNDVCQPVLWDLSKYVGQPVRLEIIDGDSGSSYAWLGITRIEPAVLAVDHFDFGDPFGKTLAFFADFLKISAPADLREHLRPFLPPSPPAPPRVISETERQELDKLIADRLTGFNPETGNAARGGGIFKTNCSICHRIAGEGGLIGPQLDGIGSRGVARLAEDVLDPNRNIDAHFFLTTLGLADGGQITGYLQGEQGEIVEILDPTGQAHRISKSRIAKRETLPISLMPSIFGQTLPATDFQDLLSWLLSQRGK